MNKLPYRGFITSDGKIPTMGFKNISSKDLHQSIPSALMAGTDVIGVLDRDVVLIDFDKELHSDLALKIIREKQYNVVVRQSTRGIHILARDTKQRVKQSYTDVSLACGLKADIKSGNRNGLESLSKDGIEKKIIYGDMNSIGELPDVFIPIKKDIDFSDMKEGSRNDELFRHFSRLHYYGLNIEKARKCIHIINNFVFKTPLDRDELEVITRDNNIFDQESIDQFYDKSRLLYYKFAKFLIEVENVKLANGIVCIYNEGIYKGEFTDIKVAMFNYLTDLTMRQEKEVYNKLETICKKGKNFEVNDNFVAFNNGLYDIQNDALVSFNPNIITTSKIPWDYNPNSSSLLVDKSMREWACGDEKVVKCLEELVGSCMYVGSPKFHTAFILLGKTANGKSVFLKLLKYMLGRSNYTSFDMNKIPYRFNPARIYGKLANIGADISSKGLTGDQVGTIKNIITGDEIEGEYKGKDTFTFTPYSTLVFGANTLPSIADNVNGEISRRLLVINFNADFRNSGKENLIDELCNKECVEYFIKQGIEGLQRRLKNKRYTTNEEMIQTKVKWEQENNSISTFVDDRELPIVNYPIKDVYKDYLQCCKYYNMSPLSKDTFSKQLRNMYGFKSVPRKVKGKSVRIFVSGSKRTKRSSKK